ncbi:ABC transporter ATP-binding protein [Endozoicomonas sp. SESOKO2]|uniref:ABC transporter ATP-binding protein n=1 Tax=Endozoicomonas sp. SESOKO2 TaxID=2828743 RepID=UPI0021492405|nr:ABC transporter ATP-binding protein [Endozoicomonas sp. SESOKO2]
MLSNANRQLKYSDAAIRVSNLSKVYHIYGRPEDRLKQSVMPRLQRRIGLQPKKYHNEFWALKDISFEVEKGKTIGIIGSNGAGKSTLLQIICGTLSPSFGSVETSGRVAALLELGSGFNPEFTGRENVYMNGSILGLTKKEIDERFNEIESFAEIGDFIDQQVKIYSSGMYVRLAFAVIAHVDAEILIIDEALAVGDALFTQKCMRFIRKFQKEGTLIFVSHDTATIQNLCEQAIWLSSGEIKALGTSKSVTEDYLHHTLQGSYGDKYKLNKIRKNGVQNQRSQLSQDDELLFACNYKTKNQVENRIDTASGWQTGNGKIIEVFIENLNTKNERSNLFMGGEKIRLNIVAVANKPIDKPIIGFIWRDRLGQELFGENTLPISTTSPMNLQAGDCVTAQFDFIMPMLPNGEYSVNVAFSDGTLYDHVHHHWINDALIVTVSSSEVRWGLVGIRFKQIILERKNG